MRRALIYYLLAVSLAVADVATLFLLSRWFGFFLTLLIVGLSTFSGILACRKLMENFLLRWNALREEHGNNPPQQIKLYIGAELTSLLIAMGLFIFPGLLSDALACVLLIPAVREQVPKHVRWIQRAYASHQKQKIDTNDWR